MLNNNGNGNNSRNTGDEVFNNENKISGGGGLETISVEPVHAPLTLVRPFIKIEQRSHYNALSPKSIFVPNMNLELNDF